MWGETLSKLNKLLFFVLIVLLSVLVYVMNIWELERPQSEIIQTSGQLEEPVEEVIQVQPSKEQPSIEQLSKEPPIQEEVIKKETIKLAMIGDILLHKRLGHYEDYSPSFESVESILQSYDYLIANQESLPVGNKFEISGYPQFSSPDYILRDLQEAGVDLVNIANNHTVDKGEAGVQTLFENLDIYNTPYIGAFKSQQDAEQARVIELGSIKIGFLSYTYSTNGLYLPKDSPFIINYIDEEKILQDVAAMKDTVDVTAVLLHWGDEYVTKENDNQRHLAKLLNDAGVDIILGTHPHIIQPYQKLISELGKETHVFYSIGNFYSSILVKPDTMVGGVASLSITKEGEQITIDQPTFVSTAVLKDSDGVYRVYPLKETEALATRDIQWIKQILGEQVIVQ